MYNIIDYINENGEKSFEDMPFNPVDSLCLSQLSYLKYDGMIPGPDEGAPSVTFPGLAMREDVDRLFTDKRYEKNNRALFNAAAGSRRFGTIGLNCFVNMIDEDWELQFSAMTCICGGFSYIVFRGTDDNVVGWKEDFNMALRTPIPSQELARVYLNRIAGMIQGRFYVGGHSKGGNLAVYAAMNSPKELTDRLIHIFSHDGPGFRKEVLASSDFGRIKDRVIKLVPRSSLVGMIFTTHENYEVIECMNFGIMQHDPFNWMVSGDDFIRAKELHRHVELQNDAINEWINSLSQEQTEAFVENLFKIITDSGVTNLNDFYTDFPKASAAILSSVENMDDAVKEDMKMIVGRLFDVMKEMIKREVAGSVEAGKMKTRELSAEGKKKRRSIENAVKARKRSKSK